MQRRRSSAARASADTPIHTLYGSSLSRPRRSLSSTGAGGNAVPHSRSASRYPLSAGVGSSRTDLYSTASAAVVDTNGTNSSKAWTAGRPGSSKGVRTLSGSSSSSSIVNSGGSAPALPSHWAVMGPSAGRRHPERPSSAPGVRRGSDGSRAVSRSSDGSRAVTRSTRSSGQRSLIRETSSSAVRSILASAASPSVPMRRKLVPDAAEEAPAPRDAESTRQHGSGSGNTGVVVSGDDAAVNDETRAAVGTEEDEERAAAAAAAAAATAEDGQASTTDDQRADANDASMEEDDGSIVIHVCDEPSGQTRDFVCPRSLLLQHMQYFAVFVQDTTPSDDLDISVHCDISIFDWLMRWMRACNSDTVPAPRLTPAVAVSVLISSEFLQMRQLVTQCIDYIHGALDEIVKIPLDLSCINDSLTRRLADTFADVELDAVCDRKDRILSRLFAHKVERLFADEPLRALRQCAHCRRIYPLAVAGSAVCTHAALSVDFHGSVVALHRCDGRFDVNRFIADLRARHKLSWRDVYWKLWAMTQHLHCTTCRRVFLLAEYRHCSYHPIPAEFDANDAVGVHRCCNTQVLRFDTSIQTEGCAARPHTCAAGQGHTLLAVLRQREHVACLAYPGDWDDDTGAGDGAALPDRTHVHRRFRRASDDDDDSGDDDGDNDAVDGDGDSIDDDDSDDDIDDSSEDEDEVHGESDGSGAESDLAVRRHHHAVRRRARRPGSRSSSAQPAARRPVQQATRRGARRRGRGRRRSLRVNVAGMSPRRQRVWKLDLQRDDERSRIARLERSLLRMRSASTTASAAT